MPLTKNDREDVLGDGKSIPCIRCNGTATKSYKKRFGKKKYLVFKCTTCRFTSVFSDEIEDMIINENCYLN